MTSLSLPARPTMEARQLSSTTLRSSLSGRSSGVWRCSRTKTQKLRRESQETSPTEEEHTEAYTPYAVRKFSAPKFSEATLYRRFYVDQQTGEMRSSATGRHANRSATTSPATQGTEAAEFKRQDGSWRRIVSPPRTLNRPFWDHSLRTQGIVINRKHQSYAGQMPAIPRTAPPTTCHLPRISRSADSTSGFEIPTRYPRGQQRPTTVASGHNALLLHHKQLLETANRSARAVAWSRARNNDVEMMTSLKRRHRDVTIHLPSEIGDNTPHCTPVPWNKLFSNNVTMRCSQQATVTSLRANKKCEDWLNSWAVDK